MPLLSPTGPQYFGEKALPKTSIACFLGAGFSRGAGIPLAKDLFRAGSLVSVSAGSHERFNVVRQHYRDWEQRNPDAHAEQYLDALNARALGPNPPLWEWAVEYISTVIASAGTPPPSKNRNPRYSYRVNVPLKSRMYAGFWRIVAAHSKQLSVLTTNYDLLVEQTLRHRPMMRPPSPGFFYGGFPLPQWLDGAAQPFSRRSPNSRIQLSGSTPFFKLHGSLNWYLKGSLVSMYQDARAVHRNGGEAAIIPPLPGKSVPTWLEPVWRDAEQALRESRVWIVCGYSLPVYDTKIIQLLKSSMADSHKTILLLSPDSASLRASWISLSQRAEIVALPGLPEGVALLAEHLAESIAKIDIEATL